MIISPNNQRLMVVDDDPDIAHIVGKALLKYGLSSDGFTDPEEALEHFRLNSQIYSLVISDIKMPGMNGFTFLEKVKQINPKVK